MNESTAASDVEKRLVKGQTAADSFKPAVLDNGVKVMVPPFVGQDEDIVVNTETMEYAERA